MNDAQGGIPLSLRRKSSARVAAVQCLYRIKINDEQISAPALMDDYLAGWKDDQESGSHVLSRGAPPDKSLMSKLLSGVLQESASLNETLRTSLNDKWSVERTSPLLIAILECAIYEMRFLNPTKIPMIIDEYVTLTSRFFEPAEVGFVNGLLDNLSKKAV